MKNLVLSAALLAASSTAMAAAPSALSLPGYFGSINNNTGYVLECSQVIGGYCANNPMPANGYIQMLPDPGSNMIRAHVMVFDKNVPGSYVDNVLFTYQEQKDGSWKFVSFKSLDGKVSIKTVLPDTVVFNSVGAKS